LAQDQIAAPGPLHLAGPQMLVRERRGTHFEERITDVQSAGPPELRGFSRNLDRGWHAVHAGFTVHWSSGPVEGKASTG